MITSYHGGNTSFSNFPFRAPFRTPRCLGWGGGGGELAKEVDFVFMFYYHFSSPFCDVQWLAGSPFYEAVILYSLLFQNLGPFLQPNFLWFCLTSGLKN